MLFIFEVVNLILNHACIIADLLSILPFLYHKKGETCMYIFGLDIDNIRVF
jgi:hypothetical protein